MATNQYSFVASLYYLKTATPLGSNWGIAGDLKVSSSKSVAESLITSILREQIGNLEVDRILSGSPFVYAKASFPEEDDSESRQMALLVTYLVHTQWFVNVLWLVRDNSVNCELGFLQYPHTTDMAMARISSNNLSPIFSEADGNRSQVQFNAGEIRQAMDYYNLLYGGQALTVLDPGASLVPADDTSRLHKSLYFLQAARAAWYLPEKIAYYCTCFESLVSTSPTEIGHQVAERVAALIGDDASHSVEIYRDLKRAYATRSKLVHGGKLT